MSIPGFDLERTGLEPVKWTPDDPCPERIKDQIERVIDAIEETFLAHLPSKAMSYCAQEDVNAGLDAMRERFGLEEER
jgi:hypothetical protein